MRLEEQLGCDANPSAILFVTATPFYSLHQVRVVIAANDVMLIGYRGSLVRNPGVNIGADCADPKGKQLKLRASKHVVPQTGDVYGDETLTRL